MTSLQTTNSLIVAIRSECKFLQIGRVQKINYFHGDYIHAISFQKKAPIPTAEQKAAFYMTTPRGFCGSAKTNLAEYYRALKTCAGDCASATAPVMAPPIAAAMIAKAETLKIVVHGKCH